MMQHVIVIDASSERSMLSFFCSQIARLPLLKDETRIEYSHPCKVLRKSVAPMQRLTDSLHCECMAVDG